MTDKQYPIGGYAPGDYLRSCTTCEKQFHGNKEAFQCESCAIKDKEFYDALTPEQRDRFDKRFANIVELYFKGLKKDEEIARLRAGLETIIEFCSSASWKARNSEIKAIATEALKPIIS